MKDNMIDDSPFESTNRTQKQTTCCNCWKAIPMGSLFCNHCGAEQPEEDRQELFTLDCKDNPEAIDDDSPDVIDDIDISETNEETIESKSYSRTISNKTKIIILAIITSIFMISIILISIVIPEIKFASAKSKIKNENYSDGIEIFESIIDKKENDIIDFSTEYINRLSENKNYEEAEMYLLEIEIKGLLSQSDIDKLDNEIKYKEAENMVESEEYIDAYYQYIRLDTYADSANKAAEILNSHKDVFYELAISNFESGISENIETAKNQFLNLNGYEESNKYLRWITHLQMMQGTYEYDNTKYVFDGLKYTIYSEINPDGATYDLEIIIIDSEYYLIKKTPNPGSALEYTAFKYDAAMSRLNVYDVEHYSDVYTRGDLVRQLERISISTDPVKEPEIGMTTSMVENSTWGKPKDINKSTYSWGTTEQWVYSGNRYIYFENGIVTAIQE